MRGQSSPTARLPAVTSTLHDPRDLAHRLSYLVGPLIGASNDGGDHGGTEERNGGAMPVETTTITTKARKRFYGLRRT